MTIRRKRKPLLPPKGITGGHPCGFCDEQHRASHRFCPVAIPNAVGKRGSVWLCPCAMKDPLKHPKYNLVPR